MKMFSNVPNQRLHRFRHGRKLRTAGAFAAFCAVFLATSPAANFVCFGVAAQQPEPGAPVVVQPGAPGERSRTLPPSTRPKLPPFSQAEAEFMRGMIMHHSQAIDMTALIPSHSKNATLKSLAARISRSQSSEIRFMRRWLAARGEPSSMVMPEPPRMDVSRHPVALMPGMLTPEQMEALRNARGAKFNDLFLKGMIQHHQGALTMIKDLFDTPGAGQDAELFDFATDADNTQRAEIRIMKTMLQNKTPEERQ